VRENINPNELTLTENVIKINRVAKVVKGGRRFSFSALVVAGDKKGHVGIGLGKANEVPEAIRKGAAQAKRALIRIPLQKGTITQTVKASYGAGMALLKPASDGTGVIAGGPVRAVVEAAGVQNLLSKSLGTSNPHNVVKATMRALEQLRDAQEIFIARGGSIETDTFENVVEDTATNDGIELSPRRGGKRKPAKNDSRNARKKPEQKTAPKTPENKVAVKADSVEKNPSLEKKAPVKVEGVEKNPEIVAKEKKVAKVQTPKASEAKEKVEEV